MHNTTERSKHVMVSRVDSARPAWWDNRRYQPFVIGRRLGRADTAGRIAATSPEYALRPAAVPNALGWHCEELRTDNDAPVGHPR